MTMKIMRTVIVVTSSLDGQLTFDSSDLTLLRKFITLSKNLIFTLSSSNCSDWQAREDLNPQPSDLESGALPIELRAYLFLLFLMLGVFPAPLAVLV